ncbi:MAG: HAD-IG family 5'-nucleotidase [bacterium]
MANYVNEHPDDLPFQRRVFCNRTLNLRSIQAIGYDMDYTLVHYEVAEWEGRAWEHIRQALVNLGWPVESLVFDPELVTRGLVIDTELGNVVKANRFGYVKQAMHGSRMMEFNELRRTYARTLVDLSEPRWIFLNTLFSISEAAMYAQLVDFLDAGKLPHSLGYSDLYRAVRGALDRAHLEGELKSEIMADPARFVTLDADIVMTLLDQRNAGKKLLLITNSEWEYTRFMMDYAFTRFMPDGMVWQDLFDLIVVGARKPVFFLDSSPIFEVVNEEGLLKPVVGLPKPGGIYLGGHASLVERCLKIDGEQILYIGDHIYGDVSVSKSISRWRTALVLRELEEELEAEFGSLERLSRIAALMQDKERLEHQFSALRLDLQRQTAGYGEHTHTSPDVLKSHMAELRAKLQEIDAQIGPLASADGSEFNQRWGYLMRAGNDKSHLTRQTERYADIYMSRVSNLGAYTPFMFFRSPRGSLPHDLD